MKPSRTIISGHISVSKQAIRNLSKLHFSDLDILELALLKYIDECWYIIFEGDALRRSILTSGKIGLQDITIRRTLARTLRRTLCGADVITDIRFINKTTIEVSYE